jgi:HK97 family phage major capsid protein
MPRYTNQIEKHKVEKRDLVDKQRKILDRAETENRAMTTEEREEFDKVNTAVDGHETRIGDLEKLNKDEESDETEGGEPKPVTDAEADDGRSRGRIDIEKRVDAKGKKLHRHATPEYRAAYEHFLRTGERRDLTLATQSSGGYLVAPIQTSEDIVKQTDNLCFVRQLARIYKLDNAQAVGVRQMAPRISDAAWTSEIGAITPDTSLGFNRRDLNPTQLTKLALVSIRLMESGQDVEPIVNEEIAYKFAVAQENSFLNGSGSGQPLGVFTASASGVPTTQDVACTGTATFIADDLIATKYSIKQTYFGDPKCRWVMARPIVQRVRTLKDSYGQYLWRAGLASDKPDTILDVQLATSEYAPSVLTTGSYIAVLGNFKYYAIAQLKNMTMQRLVELYADTSEIGFLGRWFIDGSPVLGEAFARMKTS